MGSREGRSAADSAAPEDAPTITEDAAMLLVDEHLQQAGALVACARNDVRAAIAYLISQMVGAALPAAAGAGIFIRRPFPL